MSKQINLEKWEYRRGEIGNWYELWRTSRDDAFARSWQTVTLPHCVNAEDSVDPDECQYQGQSWYRCRFVHNNPYENGRTLLRFEGAGQRSSVWIYDCKVGTHAGGYTPFMVDVTEAVDAYCRKFSDSETIPLAVCCDNSRDADLIPSDLADFNIYGGLYREVHLCYEPLVHWRFPWTQAEIDEDGRCGNVRVGMDIAGLENAPASQTGRIEVFDPDDKRVVNQSLSLTDLQDNHQDRVFHISEITKWDVDSPRCYRVRLRLDGEAGSSEWTRCVGFRNFTFEPHGPFYLNGRRVLLKGTHLHEDHAGVAEAVPKPVLKRDLELMKEMGVNFIRLGHYPQSEYTLELCDRMGFLIWEEIPWCRGGLGDEEYKANAEKMLEEMIVHHRHHPSVILWGLGNENDWPGDFEHFDENAIRYFMQHLQERAKALDPHRLTAIRRCDFCRDVIDVYSPSIWAGWYRGLYTEYEASIQEWRDTLPRILHAEWGGDSHAGRHEETPEAALAAFDANVGTAERDDDYLNSGGPARASKDSAWSETYICDLFEWHLQVQNKLDWLTGSAQWLFKDFATPLRPDNPVPYVNQKGLITRDQTKKESFFVFQSYWSSQPMVHVYGQDWPVRWGKPAEKRMIRIYSNCPEVEVFLNSQSLGTKKRDQADFPCAGLRWQTTFEKGGNTVEAVATLNDGSQLSDRVSFTYVDENWGSPDRLSLSVTETETSANEKWIEAVLLDAAGNVCLDAQDFISFGCTGGCELIDNQGTPWGSRRVQLANGRAKIKVKHTDQAVVSALVDGISPAFHYLTSN